MCPSHLFSTPSSFFPYQNHCIFLIIFFVFPVAPISFWKKMMENTHGVWDIGKTVHNDDFYFLFLYMVRLLFAFWLKSLSQCFQKFMHPCPRLIYGTHCTSVSGVIPFFCMHVCIHLLFCYLTKCGFICFVFLFNCNYLQSGLCLTLPSQFMGFTVLLAPYMVSFPHHLQVCWMV